MRRAGLTGAGLVVSAGLAGAGAGATSTSGACAAAPAATASMQPGEDAGMADRLRELQRLRLERIRLRGDDWRTRAEALSERARAIVDEFDLPALEVPQLAVIVSILDVLDDRPETREAVMARLEELRSRPGVSGATAAGLWLTAVAGWDHPVVVQREALVRFLEHPRLQDAIETSMEAARAMHAVMRMPPDAAAVLVERPELLPERLPPNDLQLLDDSQRLADRHRMLGGDSGATADRFLERVKETAYATVASLGDERTWEAHMNKLNPGLVTQPGGGPQWRGMIDGTIARSEARLRRSIERVDLALARTASGGRGPSLPIPVARMDDGLADVWRRSTADDGRRGETTLGDLLAARGRPAIGVALWAADVESRLDMVGSRVQGVIDVARAVRELGLPADGLAIGTHGEADDPAVAELLVPRMREVLDRAFDGADALDVVVVPRDAAEPHGLAGMPILVILAADGTIAILDNELRRAPFAARRLADEMVAAGLVPADDPRLEELRRRMPAELVGEAAPELDLRPVPGGPAPSEGSLAAMRGEPVLLVLLRPGWRATEEAVDGLAGIRRRFEGQPVRILGVVQASGHVRGPDGTVEDATGDPDREAALLGAHRTAWGLDWPLALTTTRIAMQPWSVSNPASAFVVDADGTLRAARLDPGIASDRAELVRALDAALAEATEGTGPGSD